MNLRIDLNGPLWIAEPREPGAAREAMRLVCGAAGPDVHTPGDPLEHYWYSPLVVEGPAPMPVRDFTHTAGAIATVALRHSVGRN